MLVDNGTQHGTSGLPGKPGQHDACASPLPTYPAYEPSGVEWLGDVPEHWKVRRLRTVADMRVSNVDKHTRDDEIPVRLCNYVDVYKNDRITEAMSFMKATASWNEIERFKLEPGDVLITKDSEAWDDIGVPSLVVEAADDLLSGYHLALLRPFNEVLGAYLALALQSRVVAYQFHVRANGVTRYGLTHVGIQSVQVPLPPLPEQAAIGRYLDHADRRIQRYLSAKRKLIALLEEERRAVVNQAVTRGLDPNVRFKPSGVEWLGDVPEHWEVRRLKTICGMKSGEGITAESIETVGEYPVYGGNGLRGYASSYTHDGAFALIGRQGALCGNVHIARGRFWASEHAVVAALNGGHEIGWFGAILTAMNLNQYSIAAAQPGLAVERVLNLHLPVPPPQEQKDIANHIEMTSTDIDAAITRARRQIELVEEYRIRLVADVVTGKLNVREAAAQLPEEAEDRELIEECGPLSDSLDEEIYDAEEEPAIAEEVRI